jgi:NADH dehydrogenase FAD-containing subunit
VRKVTGSSSPLFATEVVECVAEGRAPTNRELYAVAERIGRDSGMGPIFAWGDAAAGSAEERYLLRAAQAALQGADASP